jgi:hypothetical protein
MIPGLPLQFDEQFEIEFQFTNFAPALPLEGKANKETKEQK